MILWLIAHYCAIARTILIFRFLIIWSCTCSSCCKRFRPTVRPILHMGKWDVHEYQSSQETQKDCEDKETSDEKQQDLCLHNAITDDVMRKTVCFVYTNGNVSLGFTVLDVYTNGNVYLGFTVWDVHTNGNDWASIIVCDVSPDRTRALLTPHVWPKALSRTISGSCGKDPPLSHTHARWRFKTLSLKGGKNCLYSSSLY